MDAGGWARTSSAHGDWCKEEFFMLYAVIRPLGCWQCSRRGVLSSAVTSAAEPPLLYVPVTKPIIEQLAVINISLLPTHWGCFKTLLFCPCNISPFLPFPPSVSLSQSSGHIFCHLLHQKPRLLAFLILASAWLLHLTNTSLQHWSSQFAEELAQIVSTALRNWSTTWLQASGSSPCLQQLNGSQQAGFRPVKLQSSDIVTCCALKSWELIYLQAPESPSSKTHNRFSPKLVGPKGKEAHSKDI